MDFGLCYSSEKLDPLTAHGAILGTPLYMAPEMADGEVTPRSDIYSVGVILYQLLAARPPFEASTPVGILARALTATPPSIRASNDVVSKELEQFVFSAMEKNPHVRIATAQEFYDRLHKIQRTFVEKQGS